MKMEQKPARFNYNFKYEENHSHNYNTIATQFKYVNSNIFLGPCRFSGGRYAHRRIFVVSCITFLVEQSMQFEWMRGTESTPQDR